jgi:probable selenate reductase FAD-binding subunit
MIVDIKRPKTVREAVRAKSAPGAAYLGGGTWLNARRGDDPLILVSLENLGLEAISVQAGRCEIGAAATFQRIADAEGIPPAVRQAVSLTASRTLRNMVTLGGELGLCPDDSALVPALMALDARISLAGSRKPMTMEQLDRERPPDLILSAAVEADGRLCRVSAVSRTAHGPRSIVVAVSRGGTGPGLRDVRVVVSDCGGQRLRLEDVERELEGKTVPEKSAVEAMVGRAFSPRADMHASAEYKRYIAAVLVADALHALSGGQP